MDDLLLLQMESPHQINTWEPGFEAGRCLVRAKLGPFERLYLRPPQFRQRFYHRIHPIAVETWELSTSVPLFSGLCSMEARLKIRFQATLRYVEKNPEAWGEVDRHIREQMEAVILDAVEAHLSEMEAGDWIDGGLNEAEKKLANAINEILALNSIQCRTLCFLNAVFAELSSVDKEVYLREEIVQAIVKRQTEAEQLRFRSDQQRQEERLRQELDRIRFALESSTRKQAEEAASKKRRLEAKRRQMAELREIEQKLHQETLHHQSRLEQMVLEKRMRDVQKRKQQEAHSRAASQAEKDDAETSLNGQRHPAGDAGDLPHPDRLLKDLEWEAAHKLREKEQLIETLEQRLQLLMSSRTELNQMTVGHAPVAHGWMDRLAQLTGRLLFFIRMRS